MSLAALATVLVFAHAGDIYRVDIRTHATSRLVATPALEHSPAFSPDGKRLAFVRESGGNADQRAAAAHVHEGRRGHAR